MSRLDVVSPPPDVPGFRWFTEVRAALGLEPVRAPVFENGWANYGPPYKNAGYYKARGMVHLTGLVAGGLAGSAAFTLPKGYRPDSQLVFTVADFDGTATVDVTPAGIVWIPATANAVWVSLDGIAFRTR